MKRKRAGALFATVALISFIFLFFQNCGPAKLTGSPGDSGSGSSPSTSSSPPSSTSTSTSSSPTTTIAGSSTTTTNPSTKLQILQLSSPNLALQVNGNLPLTIHFNAVPQPAAYQIFIHFVDANGVQRTPLDHLGTPPTPTTQWNGPVDYNVTIPIPADTPLGTYSIRVGFYQDAAPYKQVVPLDMGPGVTVDNQYRYTVGTINFGANTMPNVVSAMNGGTAWVTGFSFSVAYKISNATPLSEDELGYIQICSLDGTVTYSSLEFSPSPTTSTWSGTVSINQTISVPIDVPNGDYTIRGGFFQSHSPWARAPMTPGMGVVQDDEVRYILGRIKVSR